MSALRVRLARWLRRRSPRLRRRYPSDFDRYLRARLEAEFAKQDAAAFYETFIGDGPFNLQGIEAVVGNSDPSPR